MRPSVTSCGTPVASRAFATEPTGTFLYYTLNGSSAVRKLGVVAAPVPQTLQVQVTGVAGVPGMADAVVLNMTAVNARTAGFATVYPCGEPRPNASNLNFAAGQTIANLVIAKPADSGIQYRGDADTVHRVAVMFQFLQQLAHPFIGQAFFLRAHDHGVTGTGYIAAEQ